MVLFIEFIKVGCLLVKESLSNKKWDDIIC